MIVLGVGVQRRENTNFQTQKAEKEALYIVTLLLLSE